MNYLYQAGTIADVSASGAPSSSINLLNDVGQIGGTFSDGTYQHGVVATPLTGWAAT